MENKNVKAIKYEVKVDTDDVKDKVVEVKRILDRIHYYSRCLNESIKDLENYSSICEIKYSVEACCNSSSQVSKDV